MTSQMVFFMYGRLWYCNGIVFKGGGGCESLRGGCDDFMKTYFVIRRT